MWRVFLDFAGLLSLLYLVSHCQEKAACADDTGYKNGIEVLPPQEKKGDGYENKAEYPKRSQHKRKFRVLAAAL